MIAMTIRRAIALFSLVLVAATACSPEPDIPLSAEAEVGRTLARESGCSACHGNNGEGITAPTWQGLYLSNVAFTGRPNATADEAYLFESITDPQAKIRLNWTLMMPENNLTDDEVQSVIAYIKELQ